MGFDFQNFGIGLVTGWASAYGVYRARHHIVGAIDATRGRATDARRSATRTADSRYITDLIEQCETGHLAGRYARLSDIVVEPRFLPAPELAAPASDDVIHSVFHVVPQTPDLPYLHSIYNLETMSIEDIATGSNRLVLIGAPGSGRTTALFTIVLRSLGRIRFEKPVDRVQERLDSEESALNEKERAARIKERITIEQRAKEQLLEKQGVTFDAELDDEQKAAGSILNRLMPVYVHLADISTRPGDYGGEIDPAEPLVRAIQSRLGRITASTIPRNLYRRLNNGQVLLLIDGYDDLPEAERAEKLAWLSGLTDLYGDNFIIFVAPPQGYGPVAALGYTPIYLRPWNDLDATRLTQRWLEAWPRLAGSRRNPAPEPERVLIDRARTNNRALSPAELTMKVWSTYADDAEAAGMEGWLRGCINRQLPPDQPFGALLPQLIQIAVMQQEDGFITRAQLEALAQREAGIAPTEATTETEAAEPPTTDKRAQAKADKAREKEVEKEVSAQAKFLNALQQSGLLVAHRGGRYRFRHTLLAAYLASLSLQQAPAEELAGKALDPLWEQALTYANLHTSMEDAVRARLGVTPDILHNHVLATSRWLAYASASVGWRGPLLKHLGNMLIAPNQYPLLRERAAAALVGTRDRSALFIFRQAARNANADVRRLACLAMGATGDPEAIKDLVPLLEDQVNDVQLAAGMALGAIGTDEALEAMVVALTEGSEGLRQAVAEALAAIPDEGYPILYDAINHSDMMLRRAAAFGLRRIRTTWAIIALYRAFLEDEQWYVRSAAQQAFQEIQQEETTGPQSYPEIADLAWLAEWSASKGEGIPAGDGAVQMLLRALQEGEAPIRQLAARTIGQLGHITAIRPLYAALRDRHETVRVAAYQSLADLQMQLGEALPSPV